jgi:hypothetical protein
VSEFPRRVATIELSATFNRRYATRTHSLTPAGLSRALIYLTHYGNAAVASKFDTSTRGVKYIATLERGIIYLTHQISLDPGSEAPKARNVIARANGPGRIVYESRSAESATYGCSGTDFSLWIQVKHRLRSAPPGIFGEPIHSAPSALRHLTIAAPGPLGRAITFRALGAQDNHANHKIDSLSILMPVKGRAKFIATLRVS